MARTPRPQRRSRVALVATALALSMTVTAARGTRPAESHEPSTATHEPSVASSGLETVLRRVAVQVELALGVSESLDRSASAGARVERARLLEEVGRRASERLRAADKAGGVSPEVSGALYAATGRLLEELDRLPSADAVHARSLARLRVDLAEHCLDVALHRAAAGVAEPGRLGTSADEFAAAELLEWRLELLACATRLSVDAPVDAPVDVSAGEDAIADRVLPLRPVEELALVVEACARALDGRAVGSRSDHAARLGAAARALLGTSWLEQGLWRPGVVSTATAAEVRAHVARRQAVLERVLAGAPGEAGFRSASAALRRAATALAARSALDPTATAANLYELYELAAVVWAWGAELGVDGEPHAAWRGVFDAWNVCTPRVLETRRFHLDRIDGDIPFAEIPDPLALPTGGGLPVGPVAPGDLVLEVLAPGGLVLPLRDAAELGLERYRLVGPMDYRLRVHGSELVVLAHCTQGRALDVPIPARVQPGYTLFVDLPEQSDLAGPMGLVSLPWTERFLAQQIRETLGSRPIRADADRPLRDVLAEMLEVGPAGLVDAKDRAQAIAERARDDVLARVDPVAAKSLQRELMIRASPVDAFPTRALVTWLAPIAADVLGWPDFVDGPAVLTNEALGDDVDAREFWFRTVIWLTPVDAGQGR